MNVLAKRYGDRFAEMPLNDFVRGKPKIAETVDLLVLRSTAELPAQQLAERALRAGTCHAVVMWTEKLARSALASLQKASAEGNSHGVVLRQR